jgi:flavin reductase (DIM6/NTAB) family NADH-FMN oxidoreductase RutF
MAHMFGRLFVLAIAVIVARNAGGRDAGITCLAVVVFGYTVSMAISAAARPRSR